MEISNKSRLSKGFGCRYGAASRNRPKLKIKTHNCRGQPNFLSRNVQLAKAGLAGQRRQREAKAMKPKIASETDVLSVYVASPANQGLTEYQLLSDLVARMDNAGGGKKPNRQQPQKQEHYNRIHSKERQEPAQKTRAKQFGNENCEAFSKISKIVGHQYISLCEKQRRIQDKQAFDYVKPDTPTNYEKNIQFKYQKGKDQLKQGGMQLREKGEALFKTVTRDQRNRVMSSKSPNKYTNDTGLGHVIEEHYYLDNKKKVNSKERAISSYISQISRADQYYKKCDQKNTFEDMDFVARYLEYHTEQQAQEKRRDRQIKKVETHMLLSRKSSTYWQEYSQTVGSVKKQIRSRGGMADDGDDMEEVAVAGAKAESGGAEGEAPTALVKVASEEGANFASTGPLSAQAVRVPGRAVRPRSAVVYRCSKPAWPAKKQIGQPHAGTEEGRVFAYFRAQTPYGFELDKESVQSQMRSLNQIKENLMDPRKFSPKIMKTKGKNSRNTSLGLRITGHAKAELARGVSTLSSAAPHPSAVAFGRTATTSMSHSKPGGASTYAATLERSSSSVDYNKISISNLSKAILKRSKFNNQYSNLTNTDQNQDTQNSITDTLPRGSSFDYNQSSYAQKAKSLGPNVYRASVGLKKKF